MRASVFPALGVFAASTPAVAALDAASRFETHVVNTGLFPVVYVYSSGETQSVQYFEEVFLLDCVDQKFMIARRVVEQIKDGVFSPVTKNVLKSQLEDTAAQVGGVTPLVVGSLRLLNSKTSPSEASETERKSFNHACGTMIASSLGKSELAGWTAMDMPKELQ